jgi:hypothetical protein
MLQEILLALGLYLDMRIQAEQPPKKRSVIDGQKEEED